MTGRELPVLGWKEHVRLPEWGVRLRAKLDTGARTSALHVESLEVVGEDDSGDERLPIVRFEILTGSRDDPQLRTITAPTLGTKMVRDTGAKSEQRHVVRTRIVCGPLDRGADVTLTSRHGMNFRMLLGRLTLAGACLVDPQHGYLHTPRPPRRDATAASPRSRGNAR